MKKKVFDWREYVKTMVHGYDNNIGEYIQFMSEIDSKCIENCVGKTLEQVDAMGYGYVEQWFTEVEDRLTLADFATLKSGDLVRVKCSGYEPNTFVGEFVSVFDDCVVLAIPEDVYPNFSDTCICYDGFLPESCEIL